jgi:hypothetical protein
MKIALHSIAKDENGYLQLAVSVGNGPIKTYKATYDNSDIKFTVARIDEELFMSLSDLAFRRFGNCVVYQLELMDIVKAFCTGLPLPFLPAELGTTSFCKHKPSPTRIAWNKFRIGLRRMGF